MALFGTKQTEKLTEEIRKLHKSVAELKGEREALRDSAELADEIDRLKKEHTEQQINLDRVNEKHKRAEREIDHKLGLHRQKVEKERELTEKATRVAVREENLNADRERFETEINFTRERMESEMVATRKLMKEILKRVPTVEVARKELLTLGVGNGRHEEDD